MNYFIKNILRVIIIIFLGIIYFNYRNNQCILKQNCTPIFLSELFESHEDFKYYSVIFFKYNLNAKDIEFIADNSFNHNRSSFDYTQKDFNDNVKSFKNYPINIGYNDYIAKKNNELTIAKFSITNKSHKRVKISLKMKNNPIFFSNENYTIYPIKIFNCFCNQDIILNEYETRDLYIYFKFQKEQILFYDIDISQKFLME